MPLFPAHSTHQKPFQHEIVMGPQGAAVQSDRLPPHHLHQGGHRQADLSLGTCRRVTELFPTATRRQSSLGPQSSSPRPRGPGPQPQDPDLQPLLPQTQESRPPASPLSDGGVWDSTPGSHRDPSISSWPSLSLQGWAASFLPTSLQAPLSPLLPAPDFSNLCPRPCISTLSVCGSAPCGG